MTVYKSHLPDRVIPLMNTYSFVTSNPNKTHDSFPVLTDAMTGKRITFGEWKRDTKRWATGLQSFGFKRGDVMALFTFNQVDYSIAMFGPIILGGIVTTVNASYTVDELAYQLTDSGATLLVTHAELLPIAIEGAQKAGLSRERIFLHGDSAVDGIRPYSSLMPPISTPEDQLAKVVNLDGQVAAETTVLICYSSGTTGRSKGVEISHMNICMNAVQVTAMDGPIPAHENVTLCVLPMYHVYGLLFHQICGIYNGIPTVVLQKYKPEDFLKTIQDHRIQSLNLVPPQVLLLVKSPLVKNYDLSHVRELTVGAAPTSRELTEALLAKYPTLAFRQAYGMSELSPVCHSGTFGKLVYGSVGRVVPNVEVRLVDPMTGLDTTSPGESGELWVRGPNVMKGYLNNEKANRETVDAEGWLRTGDIAVVDENENFYIVDRMKELIKYNGFQVAPAELEAVLLTHPDISDAAVIGVEDKEQATELPLAFVVKNSATSSGQALTEKDVVDHVASKVAPHKKLRGGVRFVDAIPKSAAGKILRKDLRKLIQPVSQEPQRVQAKL
ncbi:hypothetical protein EDD21DRAFT_297941 [Dissophora ornata]|nr:putative fatty-acid--CoA ligase FadD10 [Dissophora ornata]KAI8606599.1 hypothetical protein EDD21DRAFT_297941 [Dissophora ornata]